MNNSSTNDGITYFTVLRTTAILPVSLLDFNASAVNDNIHLMWSTAMESNNKGFIIERSADGLTFERIDFVNSKAENGNATVQIEYTYIDKNPLPGKNYYRLQQIDKNGMHVYSDSRMVNEKKLNSITIYPNPSSGYIMIKGLEGTERVKIVDVLGREVMVVTGSDSSKPIPVYHFRKGVYTIIITKQNGNVVMKKLVKQ